MLKKLISLFLCFLVFASFLAFPSFAVDVSFPKCKVLKTTLMGDILVYPFYPVIGADNCISDFFISNFPLISWPVSRYEESSVLFKNNYIQLDFINNGSDASVHHKVFLFDSLGSQIFSSGNVWASSYNNMKNEKITLTMSKPFICSSGDGYSISCFLRSNRNGIINDNVCFVVDAGFF